MSGPQDSFPSIAEHNGINLYNEKSLHAALKQWYARPEDRMEARVDGFIIDLVRGDLLIEIQTGSFSPLKRKLNILAQSHPVRLVFPIALEKWIVRLPAEGETGQDLAPIKAEKPWRRKSPKRGQVEQVFKELVYIPTLIQNLNFSLEVLLIREEEVRRHELNKAWRRKGWVTHERRLLEVVDRQEFNTTSDLACLLPAALQSPFTVAEAAKASGQPDWLARKMIYCLKAMGVIEPAGKRRRANLYARL